MSILSSRQQRGFTLVDMVAVVAIIGIVSAVSIPPLMNAADRMRLGQAAREVEREMQTAKSRAVGKSRPMRIRFNCPEVGQYRIVELIGTSAVPVAADTALNRCNSQLYPYPAGDTDPSTRPNLDGPLRRLDDTVTFGLFPTVEFWSDGTAHYDTGAGTPWPLIPAAGITVNMARKGVTSTITVNGLGKVQLQ
jgi:prepilin-type N-terminal cleavage/methylation domain-containing protein